jgi:hypothetical protein
MYAVYMSVGITFISYGDWQIGILICLAVAYDMYRDGKFSKASGENQP